MLGRCQDELFIVGEVGGHIVGVVLLDMLWTLLLDVEFGVNPMKTTGLEMCLLKLGVW